MKKKPNLEQFLSESLPKPQGANPDSSSFLVKSFRLSKKLNAHLKVFIALQHQEGVKTSEARVITEALESYLKDKLIVS